MILLDTHVLLWWIFEPTKLSKKARDLIDKTPPEYRLLSSMSLWEIYHLSKKNKIQLNTSEEEFSNRLISAGQVKIIEMNWRILHQSVFLKWIHTDPIDRMIVATAMDQKCILLTKDSIIQKFFKQSAW